MKAKIEKYISTDGSLRVASVIATGVIEEARQIHNTYPVASAALGRALIGAGLLASFLKDSSRLALHFKGDGPLGQVFAEGSSEGHVRGFVTNPQIHLPSRNGKLNVGGGVGRGVLSVATSMPNEKMPYTGTVELQSGEIGDDIAYYLFQSQQTPSVVALGVFVEPDNSVTSAGGVILQVMPGATEETLKKLESRVPKMRSVTEIIREGGSTSDLALEVLEDFAFRKLDETFALQYECHCSMDRVEKSLLLLGEKEIQELIELNHATDVRCDFCGRNYTMSLDAVRGLLERARQKS